MKWEIIDLIIKHQLRTVDIANIFECSQQKVRYHLQALIKDGAIHKVDGIYFPSKWLIKLTQGVT